METGRSQSWITTAKAMRKMKTSLWDLTAESKIKDHFTKLEPVMLSKR